MNGIEFKKYNQEENRPVFLLRKVRHKAPLVSVREQLTEAKVIINPVNYLRLTWFYLGRPERLQTEVIRANPNLNTDSLAAALECLLLDIKAMRWGSVLAQGEKLAFYSSPPKSFVALKLQKTPELTEGRDEVLARVTEFLEVCGISNAEGFMVHSANLKLQLPERFNPHITLGVRDPKVPLPEIDVSGIQLRLKAPYLANVKFLN